MPKSAFTMLDLAEVLSVDPDDFGLPRRLLAASRSVALGVPALTLSLFAQEGRSLGEEGDAELRRLRTRAATYRDIAADLADLSPIICKGSTTAQFYPEGLDRHVGDLDLFLPDEHAVWTAAARVAGARPLTWASVQRAPSSGDLAISLWWEAQNPLYEPDLHVDIFTTPFWGDGRTAGVRAFDQSLSDAVQSVLLILEERFQRAWRPTDDLDLRFLLDHVDLDELDRGVTALGLEDELAALWSRLGSPRASIPPRPGSRAVAPEPVEVGMPIQTSRPFPLRSYELVSDATASVLRSPFGAFLMARDADVGEDVLRHAEFLLAHPCVEDLPGVEVRPLGRAAGFPSTSVRR